jgi:hypothetical protein
MRNLKSSGITAVKRAWLKFDVQSLYYKYLDKKIFRM